MLALDRCDCLVVLLSSGELILFSKGSLMSVSLFGSHTWKLYNFSFESYDLEQSAALSAMQNCIADIRQWMLQDRLRLNDDKTELIIIGTRQQLAKVNIDSLRVGESSTAPTSKVKNLGCWFDGQLKMDTQINSICKTAFFHI